MTETQEIDSVLMQNANRLALYEGVKQGLTGLGYVGSLIQENYKFADILAPEYSVSSVPLAAFAQDPPSYRNACFGVVSPNGVAGPTLISKYRSLGAPQILEIHQNHINRWKMTGYGAPMFLEQVKAKEVPALFERNREDWSPVRILRAKSVGDGTSSQLDFFDRGLLPLLENEAREKLDRLLQETMELSIHEFEQYSAFTDNHYPPLFRLLFRLIAAKVLADRGHPGDWLRDDPQLTITAVQDFYSSERCSEAVLDHHQTQIAAWERIKASFHFQNLSVDSLAYVYEHTLVAPETRRLFGIHSTPPAVAEYITRQLPFEDLAPNQRRIFEPFAGHAVFLVAAMQRLRELLPSEMTPAQRHRYFVKMLSGIEIDPFAREVARLSLMLADYPNPNGWRLHLADALDSELFEKELSAARIVLCNPPFEDFNNNERDTYGTLFSIRKPATILHRVLQNPPNLLGFVLPQTFLKGRGYRQARTLIGQTYSSIDLVALPDKVFRHSDAEAVLLLASKKDTRVGRHRIGEVDKGDLENFYSTHELTRRSEDEFEASPSIFERSIWLPLLQEVWSATDRMKRLGDLAEVHRGIEYNVPFRLNQFQLVSATRRPGFALGIQKVKDTVEPFLVRKTVYLNVLSAVMRGNSYKRPWSRRKLVVNAARRTRGAWRITASIDQIGMVCYQNFHGVWPDNSMSLETFAAILNGPIANAFVATREGTRHVQRQTLLSIPIPDLDTDQDEAVASLVRQYTRAREHWVAGTLPDKEAHETCSRLLRMIDAEVLRAYDLPPRTERSLLDYFTGHARPGPVMFKEYFPGWFKPHIPWHRYVADEMDEASATSTLSRLPVINDPLISDAMECL